MPANSRTDFTGFVPVCGACGHNLQNINVNIPRNALMVFIGVSGTAAGRIGAAHPHARRGPAKPRPTRGS